MLSLPLHSLVQQSQNVCSSFSPRSHVLFIGGPLASSESLVKSSEGFLSSSSQNSFSALTEHIIWTLIERNFLLGRTTHQPSSWLPFPYIYIYIFYIIFNFFKHYFKPILKLSVNPLLCLSHFPNSGNIVDAKTHLKLVSLWVQPTIKHTFPSQS